MKLSKKFFIEYYKSKLLYLYHEYEGFIYCQKTDKGMEIERFQDTIRDICFYKNLIYALENN
jgi:hypothetical protein